MTYNNNNNNGNNTNSAYHCLLCLFSPFLSYQRCGMNKGEKEKKKKRNIAMEKKRWENLSGYAPAPMNASHVNDTREDMTELRGAVNEALLIAQEALKRVQQQQRDCSPAAPGLNEDALHEHLCAFEAFIICRVREETTRVEEAVSRHIDAEKRQAEFSTTSDAGGPTASAATLARKLALQLEAQRTRGAVMEQRLGQLESKLNALMTDVVAQSQRESAYRKQLASMVQEKVDAQTRVVAASLANSLQQAQDAQSRLATPALQPSGVVDLSVIQHVTAALAAMHARVEEQHAELTRWQQQHYTLMDAVASQLNALKKENAVLRLEVSRLRDGPPRTPQVVASYEASERKTV